MTASIKFSIIKFFGKPSIRINSEDFKALVGTIGPAITGDGFLETFVIDKRTGAQSKTARIRFRTFACHSTKNLDGMGERIDLSNRVKVIRGEAKVGGKKSEK